jgi:N-acetylglucosamine-6-phosphate deacetylase
MAEPKVWALKARRLLTPLQDIRDAVVLIEGRQIMAAGRQDHIAIPGSANIIDAGNKTVVPGFIDLHHHGAVGVGADEGAAAVKKIGQYLVQTGTTGWLPTVWTLDSLHGIVQAKTEGTGGADVLGIHMEGPFLAPKGIAAADSFEDRLQKPSIKGFRQFLEASDGNLKLMGVSPELDGALELIREMRRAGVVPAVAHTKGTYEQFMRAVEAGVRHVTHAYNVMTGLHHRRPGVVGGVLTCDQVTAELIADGYHVSPAAMDILIRCKGPDQVALITDNVPLAGLPDGTYQMYGGTVVKKGGISRLEGSTPGMDGTMAGSEWPLNHNVHNLVDLVGVTLPNAIRMATLTPATIIGLNEHKGSIEPGKDADLVVIDEAIHVYLTVVRGQVVFSADL